MDQPPDAVLLGRLAWILAAVALGGAATVGSYDGGLMRRAMSNVLGNASRYAQEGSGIAVTIAASADVPGVELLVANRRVAIPEEQLARVFDRFYRLEADRAGGGDAHHGLGLFYCLRLVDFFYCFLGGHSLTAFGLLFSPTPPEGGARLPRGGGSLSFLAKKKANQRKLPGIGLPTRIGLSLRSAWGICAQCSARRRLEHASCHITAPSPGR